MRKLRLLMILCVLVLISVGCGDDNSGGGGGGGSGTTATTTSAKTATVGCRKSSVQAGPGGSRADVLPCNVATSPQSADLTQGDEVWVSSQGEARAVVESCADIYIYHNSGLKVGGCCEDCAGAGSDACALSGTSAANNSCSNVFSVSTGSAVVYSDSTWFSVSYLDEQRVSLVAVIEGDVQVAPLGELDGTESVDRISVPPGAFLFTMPDDQLTELSGIPPREVVPIEEIGPILFQLGLTDTFTSLVGDAIDAGIDPGPLAAFQGAPILAAGGVLGDPGVLDAIALGVDWRSRAVALGDPGAAYLVPEDGAPINLVAQEWSDGNPFEARSRLAELGVEDEQLVVLVTGGDPGLEEFGRSLLEGNPGQEFGEGGLHGLLAFNVDLQVVNPGQVADAYQELLTEGISTLWVSR